MLRKQTVIISFDLFIPSRIPKIRLHADRIRIVSVFPDMVAETAVLEVDASAVVLLNIRTPEEPYCCLGQNLPRKDQKEIYQKVENKAIMEDK